MIFPSESLFQLRQTLVKQVAAGEITDIESYQRALEVDPDDPVPLSYLAVHAEESGDLAEAERYSRELIRTHPCSQDGYFLLSRILLKKDPHSHLARSLAQLGLEKVQFDEDAMDRFDVDQLAEQCGFSNILADKSRDQAFAILVEALKRSLGQEPIEVEEQLRPHRLVHELRESRDDVLDRIVVDGILKYSAECAPLLLGILKEFGEDLLTTDDYRVVERALVLLGEIGDPKFLPAFTEFLSFNEEDLSGPADWAFRRTSFQHPTETLAKIFEMADDAGTPERVVLAQQIAMMPKVPGRTAALAKLADSVERFPKNEREAIIMSAIAGACLVEGSKSVLAASLERKYASGFSRDSLANLRALRKETASLEPGDASLDDLSVYDICCTEPELSDEDDGPRTPVTRQPKPGRNEPCWCGSGKKYKKCHLEQDQRS